MQDRLSLGQTGATTPMRAEIVETTKMTCGIPRWKLLIIIGLLIAAVVGAALGVILSKGSNVSDTGARQPVASQSAIISSIYSDEYQYRSNLTDFPK